MAIGPSWSNGGDEPRDGEHIADDVLQSLRNAESEVEILRARIRGTEVVASHAQQLDDQLQVVAAELTAARAELLGFRSRRAVRYLDAAGSMLRKIRRRTTYDVKDQSAEQIRTPPSERFPIDMRYSNWVRLYDTIDDEVRRKIADRLENCDFRPLISIILPVYETPERYLREAIESVRRQIYSNWELCIADDCSGAAWIKDVLNEFVEIDERIRYVRRDVNGHISNASNTALGMASGEWVALFDHDDLLAEHALAVAVLALAQYPSAGMLYSDEDHIDDDGTRSTPYFKPDFDPVLLLGQNYLSHLCMLRRDLVEGVGGFRVGLEGSQDWDLVLRIAELVSHDQVVHVPHVLYHWRAHPGSTASSLAAKPYAAKAAQRAVADHLDRAGQRGRPVPLGGTGFNRVEWTLPEVPPSVSVILLPRNGERLVRCLDSVRVRSTYPDVELVVVDDGGFRPPTRQFLRDREDSITVVRRDGDYSDSALRNAGARLARGQVLCFLDDDVEVLVDRWLEEMVGLLLQEDIGAVGAKLLYPDHTVQHAGIIAGIGGTVGHIHRFFDRLEPGYFGRAMLSQCFSAVSWACMAVRREAFEAVGGFDEEHLSGLFGDVDFCLRLREAGWRTAWTPRAEMLHFESKDDFRPTGGENAVRFAREIRYLQSRWEHVLALDPAYNPNLSLAHETAPLAWPPRRSYI